MWTVIYTTKAIILYEYLGEFRKDLLSGKIMAKNG